MMRKTCKAHHEEEIRVLLDKFSSCIEDIEEKLELLNELRDEIDGEFDDYTEEQSELEFAYAQCADELHDVRSSLPSSDKKEILQKILLFDSVTPMTQPERLAVFSHVLSEYKNTADACWSAGNYLTEYRKNAAESEPYELPFDADIEEIIANLL